MAEKALHLDTANWYRLSREPSLADQFEKVLTPAIVLAAEAVHLRVVDHLIVSAQETFGFRKARLL